MMTLFFVEDLPTQVGQIYEFENEDAQHAIRVLRMSAGELFMLADGSGAWSQVKAFAIMKKSMQVEVIASGYQEVLPTTITSSVFQRLLYSECPKWPPKLMLRSPKTMLPSDLWKYEYRVSRK